MLIFIFSALPAKASPEISTDEYAVWLDIESLFAVEVQVNGLIVPTAQQSPTLRTSRRVFLYNESYTPSWKEGASVPLGIIISTVVACGYYLIRCLLGYLSFLCLLNPF